MARVLAPVLECARIVSQDHQQYGAELRVHGWHGIHGDVHLLVTLPEGSHSYVPAAERRYVMRSVTTRQLMEVLQARFFAGLAAPMTNQASRPTTK
jgi:hypothetical protein